MAKTAKLGEVYHFQEAPRYANLTQHGPNLAVQKSPSGKFEAASRSTSDCSWETPVTVVGRHGFRPLGRPVGIQ